MKLQPLWIGDSQRRRTPLRWAALFFLLLGLTLMDRGFVVWRNDPRTLQNADGLYPPADTVSVPESPLRRHHLLKPMLLSGAGLFLASILLFGRDPL